MQMSAYDIFVLLLSASIVIAFFLGRYSAQRKIRKEEKEKEERFRQDFLFLKILEKREINISFLIAFKRIGLNFWDAISTIAYPKFLTAGELLQIIFDGGRNRNELKKVFLLLENYKTSETYYSDFFRIICESLQIKDPKEMGSLLFEIKEYFGAEEVKKMWKILLNGMREIGMKEENIVSLLNCLGIQEKKNEEDTPTFIKKE